VVYASKTKSETYTEFTCKTTFRGENPHSMHCHSSIAWFGMLQLSGVDIPHLTCNC